MGASSPGNSPTRSLRLTRPAIFFATSRRIPDWTRRLAALTPDSLVYLPADIMTKVDRMSMMVSLEARAPLLDHVFVERAAAIPVSMKPRGRE